MSAARLPLTLSALLAVIFTQGCAPGTMGPGGAGRDVIGTLGISGPNVFVNNARAPNGTTVFSGDAVTTGPGSSALVQFVDGGFFQIDQNTDPIFSWAAFEGLRCIVVRILGGQAYGDETRTCIDTQAVNAVMGSIVNIRTTPQQTALTLLQGRLTVTRPQRLTVVPGQEVRAVRGRANVKVRQLSDADLRARIAWLGQYRFRGWCRDERGGVRPSFFNECDPHRFSIVPPQREPRERPVRPPATRTPRPSPVPPPAPAPTPAPTPTPPKRVPSFERLPPEPSEPVIR